LVASTLRAIELPEIEVAFDYFHDDDANRAEKRDDQHVAEVSYDERKSEKQTCKQTDGGHLHDVTS
jgi:hypothetical protein